MKFPKLIISRDCLLALIIALLPFISICIDFSVDGSEYFKYIFSYFLYFGLYPIILVGLLALLKTPKYLCSGIAFATVIQYGVYFFMSKSGDSSGLVWLGYFFTIPGVFIGAMIAYYIILKKIPDQKKSLIFFFVGLIATTLGFLINQVMLCNSILYCGSVSFI